jgi:hypothetical protein
MVYNYTIMSDDTCWIQYFISLRLTIVHRMICMDQLPHITMVYNWLYATIKYSETNDYNILLYRMNKHVI